jgi:hypothetical protein
MSEQQNKSTGSRPHTGKIIIEEDESPKDGIPA